MEYIPKKQGARAAYVSLALILIGCVLLGIGSVLFYQWAFQGTAVMLIVLALMLLTRYRMHTYVYRVEVREEDDSDGYEETASTATLFVEEVNRRGTNTVCQAKLAGLKEIIEVTRENKAGIRHREIGRENRAFYYLPDIWMKNTVVLVFDGEIVYGAGNEGFVHIAPDETFLACLRRYLPQQK